MKILAIDPGTTQSAWLTFYRNKIVGFGYIPSNLESFQKLLGDSYVVDGIIVAIEGIRSYGMPVGEETFKTCYFIGMMMGHCQDVKITYLEIIRKDVKMHLCGQTKATDANIRQALIDKYGPCGTKKNPGITYGISADLWSALAIADYVDCGIKSNKFF